MNDVSYEQSKLTENQKESLKKAINDIVMCKNSRNVNMNELIKIVICESIFLKKYHILQNLANDKLI